MSRSEYQVSYQVSPIMLVGGVAGTGMLPLISVLSSANYSGGLLSSADTGHEAAHASSSAQGTNDFFGQFRVLAGHTLMENEVAMYPVANQTVAANAIIANPLKLAVEMLIPATAKTTVASKLALMTSLKSTLDKHTAAGGWYNVATPSYIYQGCLLTSLVDGTDDDGGAQVQVRWVWSFVQPLLTVAAAQAAQNQAMSKISGATKNTGDPPGSQPLTTNIGQPGANLVQNVVPAATRPAASNVAPVNSNNSNVDVQSVSPIAPGG